MGEESPRPVMRELLREQQESRSRAQYCEICSQLTREGKPYCPEHVDHHPYVRKILAILDARSQEKKSLETKEGKARGNFDEEIISYLQVYGPRTMERLSRELNIPKFSLVKIIKSMKTKKLVKTSSNKRHSTIVRLR